MLLDSSLELKVALVGIGTNEHILKEVASVFLCMPCKMFTNIYYSFGKDDFTEVQSQFHVGSKLLHNLPTHVTRVCYKFHEFSK